MPNNVSSEEPPHWTTFETLQEMEESLEVCLHCDSGGAMELCPKHGKSSPAQGIAQFMPSSWEPAEDTKKKP